MNAVQRQAKYGAQIVAAMRASGVYEAAQSGRPKTVHFDVRIGNKVFTGDLDFSKKDADAKWRLQVAHVCFQDVLKRALEVDAIELLKIAQCPKCHEWFPSFEERNDHRDLARKLGSCAKAKNPDLVVDEIDDFPTGMVGFEP